MPAYLGSAMTRRIAVIQTFVYPNAYNDHLVWGSILVLVLTRGPGVFSLDYPNGARRISRGDLPRRN